MPFFAVFLVDVSGNEKVETCDSYRRGSGRTHATLLLYAGATLREAQAQLGHSKMSTTLEIYTISIPAAQRKAVENLSDSVTNGDELAKLDGKLPLATERIQ
jgi:integrase